MAGESCLPSTPLCIYQGDDWSAVVTIYDTTGKQPADLTGYTALAQIRKGAADSSPLVADLGAALIGGPPPSQIQLTLPHDAAVTMKGRYAWDLQLTDPAGHRTTVMAGPVTVTPEVSRMAV